MEVFAADHGVKHQRKNPLADAWGFIGISGLDQPRPGEKWRAPFSDMANWVAPYVVQLTLQPALTRRK